MIRVAVVYHSARGHTQVLAEAVAHGARQLPDTEVRLMSVDDVDWDELATADAIVFGCPTFMGSASAAFKAFMDASSPKAWVGQRWHDKLAAGFTNSSCMSGDKLNTLVQLSVFAAQHGMIWVGLGLMPGNNTSRGSETDLNRLGSHLGAMAQSNADESAERVPPPSDRKTAEALGARVARVAARLAGAKAEQEPADRHPTTATWQLPSTERSALPAPLLRCNLRELVARPGRFEHHLMVVARVGAAQLEIATASEPLYFAHANISDEYAIALPSGDSTVDAFPFRTFLSDSATGQDVARYRHGVGDLVLHPHGFLHWPGRLRPPYEPFRFGPRARRTGLTLVYCAWQPTEPSQRPLFTSPGREDDVKPYVDAPPPLLLADTRREGGRTLAVVGETVLQLLVQPERVAPTRGGYLVVLEGDGGERFTTDLVYIPPGASLSGAGIGRALLLSSDSAEAEPPPATWDTVPSAPFAVFENGPREGLPVEVGKLVVSEHDATTARVSLRGGEVLVPRYWLARMLFRLALHGFQLGYVETYGGFFYDDRHERFRLGARELGHVELGRDELSRAVERLYRAVAPAGYVERLA